MPQTEKQMPQQEWYDQWKMYNKDEIKFLFCDWIHPQQLDDFTDKTVLEAGCGGGVHTALIAPYAKQITAVDLNTIELAKQRLGSQHHIRFLSEDIASMDLNETFDIVMSIGVVHHTDDPDRTVANLKKHVKPGGKLILWVYAKEGNWMVEHIVEPLRKYLIKDLSRKFVHGIATLMTFLLYVPVYTIYLLPLNFLPYYQYFQNFRKLTFNRNCLNIFDKLNAPQVFFLTKENVCSWFNGQDFNIKYINHYKGVSWQITAERIK